MSTAEKPFAVAIGTFDGVHLGHRRVIETALGTGLPVRVLTFQPHPRVVLGNFVEALATLERRLELLAELGVAETTVVEFTLDVAKLEPEEFAAGRLADAAVVVAGEDFRFGRKRRGDLELLERLGYEVLPVPLLEGVSSTEIRHSLHEGNVQAAARLLGRPPELDGIVVGGDQRGGTLGYPTANLAVEPGLLVPGLRHLRRRRARPSRRDLDRHESALRGRGAPDRAVPARLRRRPLRPPPRRRALGAPPRRAGLRERAGPDRPDRQGRRGDAKGGPTGVGRLLR